MMSCVRERTSLRVLVLLDVGVATDRDEFFVCVDELDPWEVVFIE